MSGIKEKNYIEFKKSLLYIRPVKMKYIRLRDFLEVFLLIKEKSLVEILQYEDGMQMLSIFLTCIFDSNEKIIKLIEENFENYIDIHYELIEIVEKVNKLEVNKDDEVTNNKDKGNQRDESDDKKSIDVDRGYALIGVHCGISQTQLDECDYVYYKSLLREMNVDSTFQMVSNILANPSQEAMKYVNQFHPFNVSFDSSGDTAAKNNNRMTIDKLKAMGFDTSAIENRLEDKKNDKLKG